ncbi:hypothetical protein [Tahibacter amnicola]|uniref:Uncharacterized protein n=1 Tax=Tahibacter amnicola TaxID=2976241 RepID=A0ABY6BGI8_9GAMM|nr:hypothetical protein [Tahibacter amnicola]UXI69128.1 hypothetical protein N4264_05615 [Tahibacter amnicola]
MEKAHVAHCLDLSARPAAHRVHRRRTAAATCTTPPPAQTVIDPQLKALERAKAVEQTVEQHKQEIDARLKEAEGQ